MIRIKQQTSLVYSIAPSSHPLPVVHSTASAYCTSHPICQVSILKHEKFVCKKPSLLGSRGCESWCDCDVVVVLHIYVSVSVVWSVVVSGVYYQCGHHHCLCMGFVWLGAIWTRSRVWSNMDVVGRVALVATRRSLSIHFLPASITANIYYTVFLSSCCRRVFCPDRPRPGVLVSCLLKLVSSVINCRRG